MNQLPLRIIQISDLHLFKDLKGSLLGVTTEESLNELIELVLEREKNNIDLIILTGDLSQDGSEESYRRLASKWQEFNVPVYYVAGNHDNSESMEAVFPLKDIHKSRQLVLKNWHLILLDSHKPNAVEGYLAEEELDFLQSALQKHPQIHTAIFFHHQPVPVGSKWLDNLGLTNADAFWEIVSEFPQVKVVIFGHVHQVSEQMKKGIPCYSAPSTCIQFARQQDHFGLEHLPPGYRRIHLYPDGLIETKVERLDHYVGNFDKDAKGY